MAGIKCFVFFAVFSVSFALEGFHVLLSDSAQCEEQCVKSYSPHTSPDGGESNACSRGCRLYTISEFVMRDDGFGDDKSNAIGAPLTKPIKESCQNACVEAYNETSDNTIACKFGCEAQEERTQEDRKKSKAGEDEGPSMHLLSPLMQVRSVYSFFVGMIHVVRTSLVTYFMRDDNSIVAMESEPQIVMEIVTPDEEENRGERRPGRPQLPSRQASANHAGGDDVSVVGCVSQRLGVPLPLLVASVLVLVLFTIYVIFAVCTTAAPPKAKGFKDGLSVQADPLPLPIKLVRPEDLTRLTLMEEDDMQAPPLPCKVKLPDSDI